MNIHPTITSLTVAVESKASRLHPTMKPPELVEIALRNSSASGDLVLDPFGALARRSWRASERAAAPS